MSDKLIKPALEPDPGWGEFTLPRFADGNTFVTGDADADRLGVEYYIRETDQAVVGKVWFGPKTQGPPGHAHGGSVAAVLDEAMGAAVWLAGHAVLAGTLTCRFRKPIPLGTVATLAAWKESKDGRKVFARSTLHDAGGLLLSEGEGIYIEIPPDRFREFVDKMRESG
ncbi:MAG: PaaI family thioesterase [Deltaproteobacteria bacterium]|nr:PaaI family thioesterase [Deltaproteobacteria bacterium]